MNLGILESRDLATAIKKKVNYKDLAKLSDFVICPTYPAIAEVKNALGNWQARLGAQDVFWARNGAYTGEVSIATLKELGVKYVILGHSERREFLNETGGIINKKVKAVIESGLIPVICVGETFEERRDGLKDAVVTNQVAAALNEILLRPGQKVVVAYEPVWMIGSGQAVSPEEVEHTHLVIKQAIFDLAYENGWLEPDVVVHHDLKIIYGGSVDEENIKGFIERSAINGVLVGGASLSAEEVYKLIKAII